MGAPSVNLKTVVEADTSKFSASMKQVKSDMKDLGTVSSNALNALGNAIGVDVGKLKQMTGAVSGLGRQLQKTGTEGQQAFGKILTSIAPIGGAIAGIGLAAAVTAFKALNAEAEAFKNTVAGANIEMKTAAFIQTYRQVFHDFNTETGKSVAEFEASWKKVFAMWGANFMQNFVNVFNGKQAPPSSLPNMFFQGNAEQMGKAFAGGLASEAIAGKIYDLERKRKEQAVELARINAEIADKMSVARDASANISARQKAIHDIENRLATKKTMTVGLEKQLEALYEQNSKIAKDSVQAADALLAQKQRVYDADRAVTQEENALLRISNSITKEAKAQADAAERAAAAAKVVAASRASLAEWSAQATTPSITTPNSVTSGLAGGGLAPVQLAVSNWAGFFKDVDGGILREWPNGIEVGVKFKYEEGLMDMTREVNAAMQSLAETTGSVIGQLVGDLATGGDAWANFGDAAMSALGEMAISIGKIAIQAGIASLGIEAAITALGGPGAAMAIGAGVALVALGTAVKAGLSNVASGNYSAGYSVASGSYSTGNSDYETREVNVKVTGTLTGEGSALIGVINNTQNKDYYTT